MSEDVKNFVSLPYFSYEEIREMDYDGGTGSIMGVLVDGHLDPFEVECFMGRELTDEYYDGGPEKGFDVEHIWWSTEPYVDDEGNTVEGSYIYVYSDEEKEGWTSATRIEQNTTWNYWCIKHPEELAVTGIPVAQFTEGSEVHSVDGKNIYYCRPCHHEFDARRKAAIDLEMAKPENQSVRCPDCNMLTVLKYHRCEMS